MNTITKKIIALVSISFILTGILLLVIYLQILPEKIEKYVGVITNFWPVSLIIAGSIFLIDSVKRWKYVHLHKLKEKSLRLPYDANAREISYDIYFSFGKLGIVSENADQPALFYDQFGPMPDPKIENHKIGNTSIIKIQKVKPYFSPHFRIRNNWKFIFKENINHQISLHLHESDLHLDLTDILADRINIKANRGFHEIIFGKKTKRTTASIYSSSSRLSVIIPHESFMKLNLINPFCLVDYPQGDFEKDEKGAIMSTRSRKDFSQIELSVDGPLKYLYIDIADSH